MNAPETQTGLKINEIYASIQGETSFSGKPCVFIRLTGCNLRCVWCDTEYAFYEGESLSLDAIMQRVKDINLPLVMITGGEPLLQSEVNTLAGRLLDSGMTVLIETSGAQPIATLPAGVIRIMDLKCPGSGECERNNWDNIAELKATDEVKFVIADRVDYDWTCKIITENDLASRCQLLVSPAFGLLESQTLAKWVLSDKLPVRMQIQLHKVIWAPEARGV